MKDIEIYEFCRLMVTNETSDDPVDLTKNATMFILRISSTAEAGLNLESL